MSQRWRMYSVADSTVTPGKPPHPHCRSWLHLLTRAERDETRDPDIAISTAISTTAAVALHPFSPVFRLIPASVLQFPYLRTVDLSIHHGRQRPGRRLERQNARQTRTNQVDGVDSLEAALNRLLLPEVLTSSCVIARRVKGQTSLLPCFHNPSQGDHESQLVTKDQDHAFHGQDEALYPRC